MSPTRVRSSWGSTGFLGTAAIVISQDSVGWNERGAATASNVFSRTLGSTLGAAALGALLNLSLARGGSASLEDLRQMLAQGGSLGIAASRHALASGLHVTFWGVAIISLATLVLSLAVPHVAVKPRP